MNRVVQARVPMAFLVLVLTASTASAQTGQPGQPGGGFGPGTPPEEEKKDGVAEEAPKTPGLLPTTPVLPAPKNRRKRWKLFELDGYYRFRTNWMKNYHLGFNELDGVGANGGLPFGRTIGCRAATTDMKACEGNLSMANMRLKLMPTFNIDEGTSIFTEIDVLDNLVLGSTPDGLALDGSTGDPPLGPFGEGQDPPQAGINSNKDSIQVRRVWAEVGLALGILKFGRMPDHWGMGILANSGTEDTFNGGIDMDADYGDTVDRLSFSAIIPGTKLRGGIATDWSTKLSSNTTFENKNREGQPWDLADDDDTSQWLLTVSKLDTPTQFRDAVSRGGFAYNWGIRFAYRTQKSDYDTRGLTVGADPDPANLVARGYKAYVPDVWLKAGYKEFQLELEGVAVIGSVDNLADYDVPGEVDIRQFGGVGRFTYHGLDGKLKVGLELGAASGDQWDNARQGATHISNAQLIGGPGDRSRVKEITRFMFDRDYKVDLILFRELLGTVTNAAYAKPFLMYELTKSLKLRVANVTSFAMKPVSTPGNGQMYGIEFDTDLGYSSNGFTAGVAYGVLFPLGAMDHPFDDADDSGPGFDYACPDPQHCNAGDAGNAHTIQFRLGLSF
jgi:uncharacterized protein (TIGR04551 family)